MIIPAEASCSRKERLARSFTKPGGAPALALKGETPAGMQAAPKGSSKTTETDKIRNKEWWKALQRIDDQKRCDLVRFRKLGFIKLLTCTIYSFILHQLVHHPSF